MITNHGNNIEFKNPEWPEEFPKDFDYVAVLKRGLSSDKFREQYLKGPIRQGYPSMANIPDNFLHNHPHFETTFGKLPSDHIVVDRLDWEIARKIIFMLRDNKPIEYLEVHANRVNEQFSKFTEETLRERHSHHFFDHDRNR
jgi:hypothetical protein